MKIVSWCFLFAACGGGGSMDAGRDASPDASDTSDAADAADVTLADAWVDLPAPTCAPWPTVDPPACGSAPVARDALIPGAADPGYDGELAAKARVIERGFHAIHALYTGVNTEVGVADAADREAIRRFLQDEDGWDFAASSGQPVEDTVEWRKVAGAYGGAGAAADAYRYAVLRDEGAACDEVERARGHLVDALDALHRATEITGVAGVVARGFQRIDRPGATHTTTPLFDASGAPLPEEKSNGTWREDQSGNYPEYEWEDSCSRDMLIGWVLGMGGAWEAIAVDPTFDAALKDRLQADALAIARSLMQVGDMGYDLEIHDADGRLTFHALLNESAVDRTYIRGFSGNAQHATMALGIIATLARISADEEVASYLFNELIRRRQLHELVRTQAGVINFGVMTNFSNYNMSFTGAWLASRFLCDPDALSAVQEGITVDLYGTSEDARHPIEIGNTFYDMVYLGALTGATAFERGERASFDETASSRGMVTLQQFPAPPYWDTAVENCDADEITALRCTAIDGTTVIDLLSDRGRGGSVVADAPMPMRLRPASNYHWRSDPYRVNAEGSGTTLLPGVDFRLAYWMGRFMRLQ